MSLLNVCELMPCELTTWLSASTEPVNLTFWFGELIEHRKRFSNMFLVKLMWANSVPACVRYKFDKNFSEMRWMFWNSWFSWFWAQLSQMKVMMCCWIEMDQFWRMSFAEATCCIKRRNRSIIAIFSLSCETDSKFNNSQRAFSVICSIRNAESQILKL